MGKLGDSSRLFYISITAYLTLWCNVPKLLNYFTVNTVKYIKQELNFKFEPTVVRTAVRGLYINNYTVAIFHHCQFYFITLFSRDAV